MATAPRIVVGIDGSSRGDDALEFALVLARALRIGLLLVHVYGPGEDRDAAWRLLRARGREPMDVAVETVLYADPAPARALLRVAASRRAALIVVGPSHRAGLARILPGSTGQQLLADATRAIAVVPRGWRPGHEPLSRIGVGYDGSAEARAALHAAVTLTRALGGRLDVMRAFWTTGPSEALAFISAAELEAHGQAELGAVVQELPADVEPHARVLFNDPGRALVKRSRELDVLVLGSRGKGPVAAVWARSVSCRVIRDAACPVLVIPRGVPLTLPQELDELMLDLKGRDRRLPDRVPAAVVHSVGDARQLARLWRREGALAGVSIHERRLDAAVVQELQRRAAMILSWRVESVAQARRLAAWGVQGLISRRFEQLAMELARAGSATSPSASARSTAGSWPRR